MSAMTRAAYLKKYSRKRYDERRRMVNDIKLEAGCADCGYNEWAEALDFDHLPGTEKLWTIGTKITGKLESLLAEIAKCEVVCANCHRIRTARRPRGRK